MKDLLNRITQLMDTPDGQRLISSIIKSCNPSDPTKPIPNVRDHKTSRGISERLDKESKPVFLAELERVLQARADAVQPNTPLTFSSGLPTTQQAPQRVNAEEQLEQRQTPKPPLS